MYFKRITTLAITAMLTSTSCVDDLNSNDSFSLTLTGYVLQQNDSTGRTFTPYFYASSNSSDYRISEINVFRTDGNSILNFCRATDYFYYMDGSCKVDTASKLNGYYYINAITTNGNSSTTSLNISYADDDSIPPVILDNLSSDGSYIKATMRQIDNVYSMGFAITPYYDGYNRHNNTFITRATSPIYYTDSTTTIEYPISTLSSSLSIDSARISVYVITSNALQRESDYKTFILSRKQFLEDM